MVRICTIFMVLCCVGVSQFVAGYQSQYAQGNGCVNAQDVIWFAENTELTVCKRLCDVDRRCGMIGFDSNRMNCTILPAGADTQSCLSSNGAEITILTRETPYDFSTMWHDNSNSPEVMSRLKCSWKRKFDNATCHDQSPLVVALDGTSCLDFVLKDSRCSRYGIINLDGNGLCQCFPHVNKTEKRCLVAPLAEHNEVWEYSCENILDVKVAQSLSPSELMEVSNPDEQCKDFEASCFETRDQCTTPTFQVFMTHYCQQSCGQCLVTTAYKCNQNNPGEVLFSGGSAKTVCKFETCTNSTTYICRDGIIFESQVPDGMVCGRNGLAESPTECGQNDDRLVDVLKNHSAIQVSASTSLDCCRPENCLDSNASQVWATPQFVGNSSNNRLLALSQEDWETVQEEWTPQWVQVALDYPSQVVLYTLKVVSEYLGYAPLDWDLLGSNNLVDWTVVDSQRGYVWDNSSTVATFQVDLGAVSFQTFRMMVYNVSGDENGTKAVVLDQLVLFSFEDTTVEPPSENNPDKDDPYFAIKIGGAALAGCLVIVILCGIIMNKHYRGTYLLNPDSPDKVFNALANVKPLRCRGEAKNKDQDSVSVVSSISDLYSDGKHSDKKSGYSGYSRPVWRSDFESEETSYSQPCFAVQNGFDNKKKSRYQSTAHDSISSAL